MSSVLSDTDVLCLHVPLGIVEENGRKLTNLELVLQPLIRLRVDCAHFKFSVKIIRHFFPSRNRFGTVRAPRCVKVDQPVPLGSPLFPVGVFKLVYKQIPVVKVFGDSPIYDKDKKRKMN